MSASVPNPPHHPRARDTVGEIDRRLAGMGPNRGARAGVLIAFLAGISWPVVAEQSDAIRTELLPAGLDAKYDGEGFLFGLGLTGIYDSNLFLSDGDEEGDYSISASPWIKYRSAPVGGARFILDARYAPFIRAYLNNSSLDTLDHAGNGSLTYHGDILQLGVRGGYSSFRHADRFAGTSVEGLRYTFGVDGSYRVSDKTSLEASWRAATTDYDSSQFASEDSYIAQVTAFWEATPLIRFGPAVRYAIGESRNLGEREAWAFLLSLQYELTGKIILSASGGLELEEYSRNGGGVEEQLTGGLTADYILDSLWSFGARVTYRNLASPATRNYAIDDLSVSLSITRQLGWGSLQAGVNGSFSDYQPVGPVATIREDEQVFGAFISHRLRVFEDRVGVNSSLRYSQNEGTRDWTRWQFSTGLDYTF